MWRVRQRVLCWSLFLWCASLRGFWQKGSILNFKTLSLSIFRVIQRICLSQDVQVPICPLCGKAVPVARDELPDEPMNRHIETGCLSSPAQSSRGQIYKHRCAVKTCRRREVLTFYLVNFPVSDCRFNLYSQWLLLWSGFGRQNFSLNSIHLFVLFTNFSYWANRYHLQLVPMRCEKCGLNFCLSHRFPADHDCGNQTCSSKISLAG